MKKRLKCKTTAGPPDCPFKVTKQAGKMETDKEKQWVKVKKWWNTGSEHLETEMSDDRFCKQPTE